MTGEGSETSDGIGAFRLERVLGRGGSAIVHAARAPDGARIALKVLRGEQPTDRERRRFLDEAARMRRVEHPALVRLLDAGVLPDGRPWLAMPLLDGETVAARVARGPLPIDQALARSSMTFSGFTSRWTSPAAWSAASAPATSSITASA